MSGPQYAIVGYSMTWNEAVTLGAWARCITAHTSSAFTEGSNKPSYSLMWPRADLEVGAPAYHRKMRVAGVCPPYTDSFFFNWKIRTETLNVSGTTPQYNAYTTSTDNGVDFLVYDNQAQWWGDGGALVRINCIGPWGNAASDNRWPIGPGCFPITKSICYEPAGW